MEGSVFASEFARICPKKTCFFSRYFDEISQDTGKYCFGVDDTLKVLGQPISLFLSLDLVLKALEMGAVETLICWENLDIQRVGPGSFQIH